MKGIFRVGPQERVLGQATPGITREQAIATDRLWAGYVTTEPEMSSAWHHHSDFETAIYVISGTLRMEFGAAGGEVVDVGPGDFLYVGDRTVHRESTFGADPVVAVVVRGGEGEVVVNVDGPDPD